MSKTLYRAAMVGAVIIYAITHFPTSGGHPAKPGEGGFELSVAKHRGEAPAAQWLVKMSAGTFTMNFSWNP